jgi:hypothetical protein
MTRPEDRQLPKMRAVELKNWFQAGYTKLDKPHRFEMENLANVDLRKKDMSGCDFTGAISERVHFGGEPIWPSQNQVESGKPNGSEYAQGHFERCHA